MLNRRKTPLLTATVGSLSPSKFHVIYLHYPFHGYIQDLGYIDVYLIVLFVQILLLSKCDLDMTVNVMNHVLRVLFFLKRFRFEGFRNLHTILYILSFTADNFKLKRHFMERKSQAVKDGKDAVYAEELSENKHLYSRLCCHWTW